MISVGNMIKQCSGLLGTKEVSEWEDDFLTNVYERTDGGKDTTKLSPKQVSAIERIYKKNFAG